MQHEQRRHDQRGEDSDAKMLHVLLWRWPRPAAAAAATAVATALGAVAARRKLVAVCKRAGPSRFSVRKGGKVCAFRLLIRSQVIRG